jgi:hypothetical protein
VNHGQTWKGWERSGEKGLIISDNQDQTWLMITINETSIGDLPLIITISDTCKNQPKRLDFDNTINLSSLIVILETHLSVLERFSWGSTGPCSLEHIALSNTQTCPMNTLPCPILKLASECTWS